MDPDHAVMLENNNIAKTIAQGHIYKFFDPVYDKGRYVAVTGNKLVVLGDNPAGGLEIITAYQSQKKAAEYLRQKAVENAAEDTEDVTL